MSLRPVADDEFAVAIDGGDAQAFLDGWTSVSGDPNDVMTALFSLPLSITRTGYVSDDLQSQILQGWATTDPDNRWGAYSNTQQIVLDDAAMVVLGYPERGIAARRAVEVLGVSPVGQMSLGPVALGDYSEHPMYRCCYATEDEAN
jgi:ABC-type transport system substrate-binding protein